MHAFQLSVLVFLLHLISDAAEAQNSSFPKSKNRCLSRIRRDSLNFKPGRSIPTFVFLSEPPFVVLDPKMTSENDVKLFRCKERKTVFPLLHGIFFDIVDDLQLDDAYCVFGGPSCTFTEMVEFVAQEKHHQLIAGGRVYNLPQRITNRTRPSTPVTGTKVILIGRRDSGTILAEAYKAILKPFQLKTWMMLIGVVIFYVVVRFLLAICFASSRTAQSIARHLLGDFEQDEEAPSDNRRKNREYIRLLNKCAVRCWDLGFAAFFVITILFYEISVVNFVFAKKTEAIQRPLSALSPRELNEYVIIQGGGTEIIWRNYVDPGKKYEHTAPPWHWCKGDEDCFDKILNDTHPAKLAVSTESVARYLLRQRGACDKMTVYETAKPLHTIASSWFYGPNIRPNTQVQIDREILRLRFEGEIRKLVDEANTVPLNCGTPSTNIPLEILGWTLLTAMGGCMLFVLTAVIAALIIRRRE